MCLYFHSKVYVGSTPKDKLKPGEKPSLQDCSKVLNLFIDRLSNEQETLADDKLVRFFENMEHLNVKITAWNQKVKKIREYPFWIFF